VRAFREAKERGELGDAVYCIAGKGPELDRLRELAGDETGRSIFFLGYVSGGQKKALLSRSDGFLHPNYSRADTDFEGFGISLVEAAWFGCAVLGGKQGGVPEAIGPLPGCELADTEDDDHAVEQIRQFVERRPDRSRTMPDQSEMRRLIQNRLDLLVQFRDCL
jgi:glycosyltransferase involved in cell wall biosynthesis